MWKCWYMLIFFLHRCPTYNNLPKGCYEVKKAGQCCPTVQCENGVLLTSTNNLGTIGSGGLISVLHPPVPQAVPTLPSGGQPLPGTGGTGFMAPSLSTSKFMKGLTFWTRITKNYVSLHAKKLTCWMLGYRYHFYCICTNFWGFFKDLSLQLKSFSFFQNLNYCPYIEKLI